MRWLVLVLLVACDRAPAPECTTDDTCVLLPDELTCCVECPPVPPFRVAPAWVLDGMLIENETRCAERPRCPEITCSAPPAGCIARAACRFGRCIVIARGCELPTS